MERYAELGQDRLLNIKCRVNQPSVPRVLRFLNSDGTAHAITTYAFRIPVWKTPQATNPIFTLTIDDGLTVQGDDSNELLIEVSEARATVRPNIYFWLLEGLQDDDYIAWLNGDWDFYIAKYDGVTQTEDITINTAEAVVTITLEGNDLSVLNSRVRQTTSTATLTPTVALYDADEITEQGEALTIANPTGTPSNFNGYVLRITDDGTARAITYGDKYRAFGSALPTTTTINKTLYIAFVYNETDDKYDVLPSQEEQ